MEQNSNSQGMMSNNTQYLSSEVIAIRLDTSVWKQDVEIFLRGQRIIPETDRESGTMTAKIVQVGKPLMNDIGVQSILNYLAMLVNPHISQGNITSTDYERLIEELDNNLTSNIMNNLERWEVAILDYDHILDGIVGAMQFFLSQPIDAGTRDSLTQSVRIAESNTMKENSGGFKIPFMGGK